MGSVEGKYVIPEEPALEEKGETVVMWEEGEADNMETIEEMEEEEGEDGEEDKEGRDREEEQEDVTKGVEGNGETVTKKKRRRRGGRRHGRNKKNNEGELKDEGKPKETNPIVSTSKEITNNSPVKASSNVEVKPISNAKKSITTAEPRPVPVKILKKEDLHEVVKREQILIHRFGTIGEVEQVCFACSKVCKSRHQLNHHYGICKSFPKAYEKMDPNDRSWYMMIQYVRDDLAKASRLCMGCGEIFKSRHELLRHNIGCEKSMAIDTWDRLTCFGLLYATPYDDFSKFVEKYKEPKKIPDFVARVHTFVEDLKKVILKEKAEARLAEERMKLLDVERVEEYVKKELGSHPQAQAQAQAQAQTQAQVQTEMKKSAETPSIPTEYIEVCNCEHCDLVKTYPPLQNPALKGVENEGYYVIPMVMDGYSTVLNNRRIYIPTQNVLLRIHDLGPANE